MTETGARSAGSRRRGASWDVLRRLGVLVVAMAVVGVIVGAGVSALRRGPFSSTATVAVSAASVDLSAEATIAGTLARSVASPSSTVSVTTDDVERLLIITAADDSADDAESSANAVADQYVAEAPGALARVVDDASRATTTDPNRARNIVVGLVVGALSGLVIAIRLHRNPVTVTGPMIAYTPMAPPPEPLDASSAPDLASVQTGSLATERDGSPERRAADGALAAISDSGGRASSLDSYVPPATLRNDPPGEDPTDDETSRAHGRAEPVEALHRSHPPAEIVDSGDAHSDGVSDATRPPATDRSAEPRWLEPEATEAQPMQSEPGTALAASASAVSNWLHPRVTATEAINAAPSSTASQARLDDLHAQIAFLDGEVGRYRETLEAERIRHARAMAERSLAADAALDNVRRWEQAEIERLHTTYRDLLTDRQTEFEQAISKALAEHERVLQAEHDRHAAELERERTRRDIEVEAERRRALDEAHEEAKQSLRTSMINSRDQSEAESQLAAIQAELAELRTRCADLQKANVQKSHELQLLQRRVQANEEQRDTRIVHLEEQLAVAEQRLESERGRAAATLAELLSRSAEIAAEVDAARAENASIRAAADEAIAAYQQRAHAEYEALLEVADEQKRVALDREAKLEARISELRPH